jgi:Tfp pilus assembly protein PilP
VPGLLIDEIELAGIFRTSKGFVAQVSALSPRKSYLLKEGDQLYDGDVVSISRQEVVFKQVVADPTAPKPFREVVKSLTPT